MADERDAERAKVAIAELKAARNAWLEQYGVPISSEFVRFAEAIGELIDITEAYASSRSGAALSTSAIGAKLEAEWMAQTEWSDFTNFLMHVVIPRYGVAALPALERPVSPDAPLKHSMNCGALGFDGYDAGECTCGLDWRIKLQTEQEMHAAWRKRAEEAEKEIAAIRHELVQCDDIKLDQPNANIVCELQKDRERLYALARPVSPERERDGSPYPPEESWLDQQDLDGGSHLSVEGWVYYRSDFVHTLLRKYASRASVSPDGGWVSDSVIESTANRIITQLPFFNLWKNSVHTFRCIIEKEIRAMLLPAPPVSRPATPADRPERWKVNADREFLRAAMMKHFSDDLSMDRIGDFIYDVYPADRPQAGL